MGHEPDTWLLESVCGGVFQDSVLLGTTSWVLRSFIAAVVLVELVLFRYSCIFNLPVLWVGGRWW